MRKFINKILDVPKLIRRLWLLLWILLVILLIMKFCFGIWYPVVSNNELFNNMCRFIDDNIVVYKIVAGSFFVLSMNIVSLTCIGKKKYPNWIFGIVVNIFIVSSFLLKTVDSTIGNIFEIVTIYLAYCVINVIMKNYDRKWKDILIPIIVYALMNLWQLSIYLVRGLNLEELKNYSSLIALILQLDYYVFLTLLWIGVSYMSWWSGGWLFGKDITELKAIKEKELSKSEPDTKLIAKIDERIAELEKEGK